MISIRQRKNYVVCINLLLEFVLKKIILASWDRLSPIALDELYKLFSSSEQQAQSEEYNH